MDEDKVREWVDAYVRAWETNDPSDIGSLFTDDARYYTAPHREPWSGREAIVEGWLDRKDQPGDWDFRYAIIGMAGDLAFVQGWTKYHTESDYSNLWVIRLDPQGRSSEFVEWWMVEE